jgi:hypothetical protein
MLKYPATVANRPFLRFALENLAGGSPKNLACYAAVLPLGIVHNAILRYQDHWNVVGYLWKHAEPASSPISPHGGQQLDWPALHQQANTSYRAHSNNNEFGLDNETWDRRLRQEMVRQRNSRTDESFLRALEENQEWVDLELLLRELTEFGARPLLLSMPIHGGWYDQCGVSFTGRRAYYQKLREISARYHTSVLDFADHDADQSFCHDHMGHLAPGGLVYYSQVLDGFFHDATPRQAELLAPEDVASRRIEAGFPSTAPDLQPPHDGSSDPPFATAIRARASRIKR